MKNSKKYIIGALCMAITAGAFAQHPYDSDVATNVIRFDSKDEKISVRAGGRLSFDGAHYIGDKMDLSSGTTIGEARLNVFASYGNNFDMKIDVDFARGEVTFRDMFARWNIRPNQSLRIGHYVMPFSLDRTASSVDRYFMATSASVNALTLDRRLGISYRGFNDYLWGEVGVFGSNVYKRVNGDDGWGTSARLVFNPELGNGMVLHIGGGFSFRTPDPNGFTNGDDDYNRFIRYASNVETTVDRTNVLDADIEWAKNEFKYNAELLLVGRRFFVQSEFTGVNVNRKRDNQRLFEDQLGGMWSFQTLEAWEDWYGRSLRNVDFKGVYVQAAFLVKGSKYNYNRHQAITTPCRDKGAIEVVARYNHTNLNDVDGIWDGEKFTNPEKGPGYDAPNFNYSIGGGRINSYALGVNYYFNKYARVLVNYGYQHINSYTLEDSYNHTIQARLQISF